MWILKDQCPGLTAANFLVAIMGCLTLSSPASESDIQTEQRPGVTPDFRQESPPLTAHKGNFVVVPIPFSNPTLDSGLILGAAYFHRQSDAQKAVQPPSVTGAGFLYSENESWGVAAGHSAYWDEDRWRASGIVGYADLRLPLLGSGTNKELLDIDWLIKGTLLNAQVSRRLKGDWYLGVTARYLDVDQQFNVDLASSEFVLGNQFSTTALGVVMSYDSRDQPTNAYSGQHFSLKAMYTAEALGGDLSYQGYDIRYRRYHSLLPRLVLAWELAGCRRSEDVPLWDACRVGLRGFASTDFMGKSSWRGQTEARWRFTERWGAVAFAGVGQANSTLSEYRDDTVIPSYGLGMRFMVQKTNRINLSLDYGRSRDSSTWTLSVMEAL